MERDIPMTQNLTTDPVEGALKGEAKEKGKTRVTNKQNSHSGFIMGRRSARLHPERQPVAIKTASSFEEE